MQKLSLIALLILVAIPIATALVGNTSTGTEVRFATGYVTVNSTNETVGIQGFGNTLSYTLKEDLNYKGWLARLGFNFFAPRQVKLHLPVNDSYFNYTPVFDWSNTTDVEEFKIAYLFEIYNDTAKTNIHYANYTIKEVANTTSTTPVINGDGIFYWQVLANDSEKNSTASELRTFTMDTTLPANFNLTSPANGTSSTDTTPELEWETATDTNFQNYTVELSNSSDFGVISQTEYALTSTLTNWSDSLSKGDYYWRVRATDKANNMRLSDSPLVFIVAASEITTILIPTSEASSGGGTKPLTLSIVAPEGVIIYRNDRITIPLLITNPSSLTLRGVVLKAASDEQDLTTHLDRTYIPLLSPGQQEKLDLIISSGDLESGSYGLTIEASVTNPGFRDTTRIFANLLEKDQVGQSEATNQLTIAKQLFNGNPECLDLSEYLIQADFALQNGENEKALGLAQAAMDACNKLLDQKGAFGNITGAASILDKVISQVTNKIFLIVASQIVGLLVLLVFIIRHVRHKKKPKHLQTAKWLILLLVLSSIFYTLEPSITGFTVITVTNNSGLEPLGNFSSGTFIQTNLSDEHNNITLNLTDGSSIYASQGNYTSGAISPGNISQWTNLTWTNTTADGTNISFQIKSCLNSECNTRIFVGPDNTSSTYFTDSAAILNETLVDNSTHFQFKAFLDTNDTENTPILEEVEVAYEDPNDYPVNVSIFLPTENQFTNVSNFTIQISNATDIEGDSITYYLEIWNETTLTNLGYVNASINETENTTKDITSVLEDGDYYLRVLAKDSNSNSTFTSLVNFTIDTTLPTDFNLTAPNIETSTSDNTPTLEWDATTDTNFQNYTVELSLFANFSEINLTQNPSTNSFTSWTLPLSPETYHWRVLATDKANNIRISNPSNFTITGLGGTRNEPGGATFYPGGSAPKPFSFNLIAPPEVTILVGETITIPLNIQNIGKSISLNHITLSTQVDSPGITASLDITSIPLLKPQHSTEVNLVIDTEESLLEGNSFSLIIKADVDNPKLTDSARILANIQSDEEEQANARQRLAAAERLFNGNPECSSLQDLLNQAKAELDQDDESSALISIGRAIDSCKDLIKVRATIKSSFIDITINTVKENKAAAIISSQVLLLLIAGLVILNKFLRKRKAKKLKLDF